MKGFHLGLYYTFLNIEDKDDANLKTDVSSIGITGGYQWIFNNHLTLGTNLGIGSLNIKSDVKLDIGKFFPNLGMTLGYNF